MQYVTPFKDIITLALH